MVHRRSSLASRWTWSRLRLMRVEQRIVRLAGLLLCAVLIGFANAQSPERSANTSLTGTGRLSPAQLDQLTAPIALYPDPLLGSILAAATYPLEVVEAARWLEDPAHAALKGEALAAALEPQSWDPSVKFVVSFSEVLRMMNSNLEWTEELGDAFLAQQAEVMDSVQRLRQRAAANGTLTSTPQQTVSTQQNDITIEPTSPDVIYVPYYVPATAYGPWPWPDYPPYYFLVPPDAFYGGALIGFGIGISMIEPFWGWYGWNWPGHGFTFFPYRPRHGPRTREPQPAPRPWQHDPDHRRGVPYRDSATAARYLGADAASRRAFRGFSPETASHPAAPLQAPAAREGAPATPQPLRAERQAPPAHPAPPAFESFGRGPQVRGEASRGSFSRSAPAPSFHGGGATPGHR
jgi:Protein of unknown function (DUF3300)